MSTLWHGRFDGGPADELLAYTVSLPFDRRLAPDDLVGSRAARPGAAPGRGARRRSSWRPSCRRSRSVEGELAEGSFAFLPSDEDIHTAVERRVTELAGPAGAKLHTGRSRNDQVATDLRLYAKRAVTDVAVRVGALQDVLLDRAVEVGDAYLPGYTHLQRAQPVGLAHHLLAHGWALARDVDRLVDCRRRLDVSPLGAGALAGSSLPARPRRGGGGPRVRRVLREQPRRGVRPRLRGRGALHADAHRHPPQPDRRGDRAVDLGGVRLRRARRRLRHRQLDAPAEEEPRHRRAGPRQGGSPDRRPHRAPRHAQGPAPRVQPRPAGGQGAAVRRGGPGVARPGRDGRSAGAPCASTSSACRPAADTPAASATDLAEHLVEQGHAVPGGARRRRRAGAGLPRRRWLPGRPRRRPPGARRACAWPCSVPACRSPAAPHRAVPGRQRWPCSSSASGSVGPPTPPACSRAEQGVARRRRLGRAFYRRDPRVVAPELLGKVLVHGAGAARIVEVEAYCGAEDPGSHAFRGPTKRNATMFGPPGGLYVYFTYGMHWCANAVCGEVGEGIAVLLRAAVPVDGLEDMRARRPAARRDRDLCRGPARLCQALALDGALRRRRPRDRRPGRDDRGRRHRPRPTPAVGVRIGLTAGADLPWRWWVPGDPHVSRPG